MSIENTGSGDPAPQQQPGIVEDAPDSFTIMRADGSTEKLPKAGNESTYTWLKNNSPGQWSPATDMPPPAPPLDGTLGQTVGLNNDQMAQYNPLGQRQLPDGTMVGDPNIAGLAQNRTLPTDPTTGVPTMIEAPGFVNRPQQPMFNDAMPMSDSLSSNPQNPAKAKNMLAPGDGAPPGLPATTTTTETGSSNSSLTPQGQKDFNAYTAAAGQYKSDAMKAMEAQRRNDEYKMLLENDERQAQHDDYTKRVEIRDKEIADQRTAIQSIGDKYSKMTVDGNRLFGDGETGNKILATLGLALGAIGTGLSGGNHNYSNDVMGVITGAIQRDIDVQQKNIEKTGREVELRRGALHDYMEVTRDSFAARELENKRQLEWVANRAQQFADRPEQYGPVAAANASKIAMDASEKAAQISATVNKHMEDTKTTITPRKINAAPEAEVAKMNDLLQQQAGLQKMADLKQLIQAKEGGALTGPLAGRWLALKDKLGMNGADETEFLQKLKEQTVEMGHALAGARGAAQSSQGLFRSMNVNELMTDKAFDQRLKDSYNDIETRLQGMQAEQTGLGNVLPLQAYRAAAKHVHEAKTKDFMDPSFEFKDSTPAGAGGAAPAPAPAPKVQGRPEYQGRVKE